VKQILAIVFLFFSIISCSLVESLKESIPQPEIQLQGLSLSKVTLTDITFLLNTTVKNPYGVALPKSDLALDIKIEGLKLTNLQTDLGKIAPKTTKELPFFLQFKYADLLKFYKKFPNKETLNLEIVGDLAVPIPSQYQIAGKKNISLPIQITKAIPSALPNIEISNFSLVKPDLKEFAVESAKGLLGEVLGKKDPNAGPKIETEFDLTFLNKAASSMNLNDIKFNLTLDGEKFVTASPQEIVNEGKTSLVRVRTSIPILNAGSALMSIAKNRKANYQITGISAWSFAGIEESNIPFQYEKIGKLKWK